MASKAAILKNPLVILAGVVVGTLIGIYNVQISASLGIENFAHFISFPGELYLFYLQMTVIPIVLTAIPSSLGKLIRSKTSARLIRKIVIILVLCMAGCALAGMLLGFFGRPGSSLDDETRTLLSHLVASTDEDGMSGALEINLGSVSPQENMLKRPSMTGFFREMIPSNIFMALSLGSTMAIVFFAIVFGVAIGSLPDDMATLMLNLFSAVFAAFQKLINWSLYLLPFGLVCLLAGQIADVGIHIFMAMSRFITLYCVGAAVIFLIATIIIWIHSGIASPFKVFSIVFEPILLSFATRNSMAALPSAISVLDNRLGFNSNAVNLTLPLGMTLGRFGNIFYFGLAVFFVVQMYNTPLEPIHYAIIFIGVIFAGTATAGASGIVTLSMMSIVLDPLRLPLEAVLIIFMAIDPIIDPFRTFLIVYVNMLATCIVSKLIPLPKNNSKSDIEIKEAAVSLDAESPDAASINEKKTKNNITVFIQENRNFPPFLFRRENKLLGFEIEMIKEIARILDCKLFLQDGIHLTEEQSHRAARSADCIAGLIDKTKTAPQGFRFSQPWASVTRQSPDKTKQTKHVFAFFINVSRPTQAALANRIDAAIMELRAKKFLQTLKPENSDGDN